MKVVSGDRGADPADAARAVALVVALGLALAALIRIVRTSGRLRRPALPASPGDTSAAAPSPEPSQETERPLSSERGAGSGCVLLLVAVAFAMLAFVIYTGLREWHRPVKLTASANSQQALRQLTLTSADSRTPAVGWKVDGSVTAAVVRDVGPLVQVRRM
jgi:hypothetical protein